MSFKQSVNCFIFYIEYIFERETSCISVFFSIDVNIFSKKFKSFVESKTKIERFSNITKYLFNNLLMSVNEIKNIFAYHKNNVNKIRTYFKYDVHQKVNDKLINITLLNDDNMIKINNFQDIVIYESCNWFEFSHVVILKNFFQINFLIEKKKCDLINLVQYSYSSKIEISLSWLF